MGAAEESEVGAVCLGGPEKGFRGTGVGRPRRVGRLSLRAHEIRRGQWRHVRAALGGEVDERITRRCPRFGTPSRPSLTDMGSTWRLHGREKNRL